jgi:hypothetical protein
MKQNNLRNRGLKTNSLRQLDHSTHLLILVFLLWFMQTAISSVQIANKLDVLQDFVVRNLVSGRLKCKQWNAYNSVEQKSTALLVLATYHLIRHIAFHAILAIIATAHFEHITVHANFVFQ